MERSQQSRVVKAAEELEKQEALQKQVDARASKMMHLATAAKAQMRAAAIAKAAAAERKAHEAEQKAAAADSAVQKLGVNNDKFLDLNPPSTPPKQKDPFSNLDPPVYKAKGSDGAGADAAPKAQKSQTEDKKVRHRKHTTRTTTLWFRCDMCRHTCLYIYQNIAQHSDFHVCMISNRAHTHTHSEEKILHKPLFVIDLRCSTVCACMCVCWCVCERFFFTHTVMFSL
jgi:hypothetical protein